LTIGGRFKEGDILQFLKQMIEQVKLNLNSRSSLLTLILGQSLSIKTLISIHKMLEKDITVSQKLKVEVSRNSESGTKKDYAEVIPQIEEEKHSIQHRYISMKARN
jgi:hypothetical protein